MRSVQLLFLSLAVSAALLAADPPYSGKWRMNSAKSDFGQITVSYEQLPSGEMQATADGQSYKFKVDGKDYPDPFGQTAAWRSTGASSWETAWKLKGKALWTDTVTLSADGKALTVNSRGTKPNGESLNDSAVFERVSGGPGLAGKWKTKNMNSGSPSQLEIAAAGPDGLDFKVVDMNLSCATKLDGKDYSCTGPTLAPGWTMALTKSGASGLSMTVKMNGKLLYKMDYSVSADGKTLTESGGSAATGEKIRIVYDRQ